MDLKDGTCDPFAHQIMAEGGDVKKKKLIRRNLPINTTYKIIDSYYTGGIMENPEVCDNCNKPIANVAKIEDADGKEFRVGMDCAKTLSGIGDSMDFMMTENNFKESHAIRTKINKNVKDKNGVLKIENYPSGKIIIDVSSDRGRLVSEYLDKEFFFKYLPDFKDKIVNPDKNLYVARYQDNHDFGIDLWQYFKNRMNSPEKTEYDLTVDEYKINIVDAKRSFVDREGKTAYLPKITIKCFDKSGSLIFEESPSSTNDISHEIIWGLNEYNFNKFHGEKMEHGGNISTKCDDGFFGNDILNTITGV